MSWCPKCKNEYRAGIAICPDCKEALMEELTEELELIERIDKDGYEWIQYELGISVKKEDAQMNTVSIGTCGVKDVLTKGGK